MQRSFLLRFEVISSDDSPSPVSFIKIPLMLLSVILIVRGLLLIIFSLQKIVGSLGGGVDKI